MRPHPPSRTTTHGGTYLTPCSATPNVLPSCPYSSLASALCVQRPFAQLLAQYEALGVPTAVILEPDSLPNLVTNAENPRCGAATRLAYSEGVAFASTLATPIHDAPSWQAPRIRVALWSSPSTCALSPSHFSLPLSPYSRPSSSCARVCLHTTCTHSLASRYRGASHVFVCRRWSRRMAWLGSAGSSLREARVCRLGGLAAPSSRLLAQCGKLQWDRRALSARGFWAQHERRPLLQPSIDAQPQLLRRAKRRLSPRATLLVGVCRDGLRADPREARQGAVCG